MGSVEEFTCPAVVVAYYPRHYPHSWSVWPVPTSPRRFRWECRVCCVVAWEQYEDREDQRELRRRLNRPDLPLTLRHDCGAEWVRE